MTTPLETALAECSPEQRAGFAAHLALLAGPEAQLTPDLIDALDIFMRITRLDPKQSAAERQARIDEYYRIWPMPASLLALLDTRVNELIRARATTEAASDAFGSQQALEKLESARAQDHVASRVSDDELFNPKR